MVPSTGTGSRPLLYPVAAWTGTAPSHAITCIGVSETPPTVPVANEDSSAASVSPAEVNARKCVMTGSSTGELISWESRPAKGIARIRARALCFHSGAASTSSLTHASINGTPVFVSASTEGFVSVWSSGGGRCRRSALALPFAATRLTPLYAWSASVTSPPFVTAAPPPPNTKAATYIICSGAATQVYILRLPRLQVVAILGSRAPLVSSSVSVDSPTASSTVRLAQSPGPILTTIDVNGVVSIWKLADCILSRPSGGSLVGSASFSSPASPMRGVHNSSPFTPSSPPPPPRYTPGIGASSPNGVSVSPPAASMASPPAPTLCASNIYIATDGVPLYELPQRTFSLPPASPSSLMASDPSLVCPLPRDVDMPDIFVGPNLVHTGMAVSHDGRHILVTCQQHFMILSTQHNQLAAPIQSMHVHIERVREAQDLRYLTDHTYSARSAVLPWSDTDALIGCGFLIDPNATSTRDDHSTLRFAVWSHEGGIWIFRMKAGESQLTNGQQQQQQPAESPTALNENAIDLHAVCHLIDLHKKVDNHDDAGEGDDAQYELLVPSAIKLDGKRILAGNVAGQIYQWLIPFSVESARPPPPVADPASVSVSSVPAALPVYRDHWFDSASHIWHVCPSQVAAVADAFTPRPKRTGDEKEIDAKLQSTLHQRPGGIMRRPTIAIEEESDTPHYTATKDDDDESSATNTPRSRYRGGNSPAPRPRGLSRTQSLDRLPGGRSAIARRSSDMSTVEERFGAVTIGGTNSVSRSTSVDDLATNARSELTTTQPPDVCTVSCMLVDSRRKHVVLARGFKSGAIHLISLCGPVHGTLSAHFQSAYGSDADDATPPRLELTHAHASEVTCMLSLEKRQVVGDGIIIMMVSGSLDGCVCTWEMQTGRLLHRFTCGYPVVSIHQPIAIPTIHALVQAQKAGMLYPATSDRVPATHQMQSCAANGQSQLNPDLYNSSPLADARALNYDVIYHTPPSELLFVVLADRSIRSIMVLAHDNAFLLSHLQSSPYTTSMNLHQLESECNRFMQVYRGHATSVKSVFYNSLTADRDMLVSQTSTGTLHLWCFSSGELEQVIDEPGEIHAFLQNFDLVKCESQLSQMAYQLRQLSAFAPGLFQLATDADASTNSAAKQEKAKRDAMQLHQQHQQQYHSSSPSHTSSSVDSSSSTSKASLVSMRAISFAKSAMKRVSTTLRVRRRSSGSGGADMLNGFIFGSSSLGSSAGYIQLDSTMDQANQNHILSTYILNRFLFHQQNPSFNASILSTVVNGVGMGGDGNMGNGTAAIVYRPSLLKRSLQGIQTMQSIDLHDSHGNAFESNRFSRLQLSVYALDMQRLNVDISTRYAALSSSGGVHARTNSRGGPLGLAPAPAPVVDSKRDMQSAWHSVLAMLFDWDTGAGSIGHMLQHTFHFNRPASQHAYAVFSDRAQALTVLFPTHSIHSHRRWTFDPEASASHLLSLSSILHSLANAADSAQKSQWDKVLSYYHHHLPKQLPFYTEADLTYLSLYSLNASETIHVSARSLVQGVIERSSPEQRLTWWREWSTMFAHSAYGNVEYVWRRNLFSLALLKREEVTGLASMAAITQQSTNTPTTPRRTLISSSSTSNLFSRKSGLFSSSSSGGNLKESQVGGGGGGGSSSNSSNIPPPAPILPEFVTDKEFMAIFILTTIYIFEVNLIKWNRKSEIFGATPQQQPSSSAAADSATPSRLAEMESKVPLIVHTILRQLAFDSSSHGPIVKPCELVKLSLACDMLSHGLNAFLPYIPIESMPLLIRRLQYLSLNSNLVEKALTGGGNGGTGGDSTALLSLHVQLFHAARRLLLEVGKHHPDLYMFVVGKEILLKNIKTLSNIERSIYLANIVSLIRRYPKYVNPILLDPVHTILKMLHPDMKSRVGPTYPMCLDILRCMDGLFPKVNFHEPTGRFAIGTTHLTYHTIKDDGHSNKSASSSAARNQVDEPHALIGAHGVIYRSQRSAYPYSILVFDLASAGKWRILEGHKHDVTAVAFDPSGSYLASYCAGETPPTLRIWKLGESGFVSDLLHSHGKMIQAWNLNIIHLAETIRREQAQAAQKAYNMQQSRVNSQQVRVDRAGIQVPVHHANPNSIPTAAAISQVADFAAPAIGASAPAYPAPGSGHDVASGLASSRPELSRSASLPRSGSMSSSLPISAVSSAQLSEEDETPEMILASKLMSARIRWTSENTLVLTREDGSTYPVQIDRQHAH